MHNNARMDCLLYLLLAQATGQKTKMLLNEYITFIDDWCDLDSATPAGQPRATKCPNWQDPATAGGDPVLTHKKGVGANRQVTSRAGSVLHVHTRRTQRIPPR